MRSIFSTLKNWKFFNVRKSSGQKLKIEDFQTCDKKSQELKNFRSM